MAYIYDLTDTWNAGGTTFNAIKMNVTDSASAAGSKLVTLQTNGTEHFSVTKAGVGYFSGNVGIGTASPSSKLTVLNGDIEVNATGLGNTTLSYNGTTANLTVNSSSASLVLGTSSTERMRIDSAGNVGIGTSSPGDLLHVNGNIRIGAATGANYIYSASTTFLAIQTGINAPLLFLSNNGSTETMRITSAGDVGIGTSSPSHALDVYSAANGIIRVGGGNATNQGAAYYVKSAGSSSTLAAFGDRARIFGGTPDQLVSIFTSASPLTFDVNGSERMRIDASGNVGIGTSSPSRKFSVQSGDLVISEFINTTTSAYLDIADGIPNTMRLGSFGGVIGIAETNTTVPTMSFVGGNVGIGTSSPQLKLVVSNSGAAGLEISPDALASSPLIQSYNRSGAAYTQLGYNALQHVWQTSGTERMRIDTSGNLLVGKTTATITDQGAEIKANGQINSALPTGSDFWNAYSTSAAAYRFYVTNGGTIYATSTSITAISDQRLKENVRDLDAGLDAVLALKPRRFDWKEGKGKDIKDDMGFIAQEVENVLPELIGGWKAGEGEPDDLKSVKAGDLIPILVKAIQELTARVAQLEGN